MTISRTRHSRDEPKAGDDGDEACGDTSVWDRGSDRYRQHLAAIVEASRDAITCVDMTGRFVAWNAAATRMFGYTEDEILGQPVSLLVPERMIEEQKQLLGRLQSGELVPTLEVVRRCKDGRELPVAMTVSALRDESGAVYAVSGSFRDQSQLHAMVRELRSARDSAQAASQSKSQFLANMSHEIRTPMHGVLGMTSVLLGTALSPEQREYLETIESSGQALLAIIDDILDLSKIEAGKIGLSPTEFEIPPMVKNVAELMGAHARQKQLKLQYRVDPGVPARAIGDAIRVQQVLTNLISNAVKFTERGAVSVRVEALARTDDVALIRFEVEDTGAGIPTDRQAEIFELFTQLDATTTRRHGGAGLGLAISRRLTELMGGQIGVDSTPGQGSVFWFTVQLETVAEVGAPRAALRGARVLIIDEDAVARSRLSAEVRAFGASPDGLAAAREALRELRDALRAGYPYRMVFARCGASDRAGELVAAIRAIKSDPRVGETAVIVIRDGAAPDTAAETCADLVLHAPVRPVQLKSCLVEVLGQEPPPAQRRGDALSGTFAARAPRVLLVEDNTVNQKVARSILERLGCVVELVENGERAVELFSAEPWALVLMDCQMPVMNGFVATGRMRAHECDAGGTRTPIIAMTADAMRGDRERCLAAGMDDYLPKPFTVREMAEMLDRWLEPDQDR